jgi:hypothetical protein
LPQPKLPQRLPPAQRKPLNLQTQNQFQGRFTMNSYSPTSIRSNIIAAVCTVMFSATCLIGTLAPAHSAGSNAASLSIPA